MSVAPTRVFLLGRFARRGGFLRGGGVARDLLLQFIKANGVRFKFHLKLRIDKFGDSGIRGRGFALEERDSGVCGREADFLFSIFCQTDAGLVNAMSVEVQRP